MAEDKNTDRSQQAAKYFADMAEVDKRAYLSEIEAVAVILVPDSSCIAADGKPDFVRIAGLAIRALDKKRASRDNV